MLNMKYTRIFLTESRPVMPSFKVSEEGMALVEDIDGNETKVRPSAGVAGEIFAGVALARNAPPILMPMVEEGIVVPASLTLQLSRTPTTGQLLVMVNGSKATIVGAAPASASQVELVGNTLTFHASVSGQPLFIQYMYAPTVKEARTFTGDAPIGGLAAVAESVVGVITRGEFATNFYDASCDWSSALQVKLGPNGIFTTTGNGTTIPNVVIRNRPNGSNAMLVLAVN